MVEMNTSTTDESACSKSWRKLNLNGYEYDVRRCPSMFDSSAHSSPDRASRLDTPGRPMNERRLRGWSSAYCSDKQVEWF